MQALQQTCTQRRLLNLSYVTICCHAYKLDNKPLCSCVYIYIYFYDRLCGLVIRILGYRSGGPGSITGTARKKKLVGLYRGPLSLVSTTEELLDRKVAAPV
jgi:hypothetical protein